MIDSIAQRNLSVEWILETHVHADHLSAAQYLKAKLGGSVCTGSHVRQVQNHWAAIFDIEDAFGAGQQYFDEVFEDGDVRTIGGLTFSVLHTPGHTPADVTYLIDDAAFVGDLLFTPDYGTARADFPGGNAARLYRSIRLIFDLPQCTRLFSGHDYLTPGRSFHVWESSVQAQRTMNIHINDGITEEDFVAMRTARDAQLALPSLIFQAVQVNMRAGRLPPSDESGAFYFKIPADYSSTRSGIS